MIYLLIGCTKNLTGKYDPSSDPDKDLCLAKFQEANSGKYIIVQVGGNWCPDSP